MNVSGTLLVFSLLIGGLSADATPAQGSAPLRVSTWYWLNCAPRTQWKQDFEAMHQMGLTDVLLVWGLDAAAFSLRPADSHEAIRLAHAAGLGSYLFVWHARHSSLPRRPEFQQMDAAGHLLFAFDTFNPQWRRTEWREYLTTVAREYRSEAGLAGYVFDNSFAIGQIQQIDGASPTASEAYISYNKIEEQLLGRKPPASPQDSEWTEWTEMRKRWWAEWAQDTRAATRAADPDSRHQIYLEDGENAIDPDTTARVGLDLTKVVASFDVMGAYWAPAYSEPGIDAKLSNNVADYLRRMRAAVGPGKTLVLSLRLSEGDKEDTPGKASYPILRQIESIINQAVSLGIRQIDLYGCRMGVYHLDNAGWHKYQPGSGPTYPLTGQIEGKFLADRPELRNGLGAYLRGLRSASQQGSSR